MNNYKRQKVSAYIKANFIPPFPCQQSIINAIKKGELPGSRLAERGPWYVHVDDNGMPVRELNAYEIEALKMYKDWQNVSAQ